MILEINRPQTVLKLSGNGRIVTPSDYFADLYAAEARMFGPPILEKQWVDLQGELHVEPVEPNIDFFAAVIGGAGRSSKVIFYQPEHLFYKFDATLGYFTPTTEQKIKLCLSQEFIGCATFFSKRYGAVDVQPLFQEFRGDEMLIAIVERSKALLAKDATFFAEGSGNRKDPVRLSGEQTARLFVAEAVTRQDGAVLKLGEAYDKYWYFCDLKGLPAASRNTFKVPTAEAIRQRFNLGFRNDLSLNGKSAHGWKDLSVEDVDVETALAK